MAVVRLNSVNKRYGDVHAVKDVSLEIADEEFVVLVGPSGCGKSTTLRMVAGLEDISGGTIEIGGRVVNALPPKDRDIAMVFQNYALYQHMTVYDNLAFGLRNRKVDEDKIRLEVDRAVAILGIGELLKRKPRQLSGGQQQRVALGRCIVRHPQVFLFDEPLSNLDAKLRAQMRVELKRLRKRVATTSIYVTHDQVEAMTLGDRVVVMHDGWVQQVGTPLQIYNEPRNQFVAGFIGAPAMNFVPVSLRQAGDDLFAESDGLSVALPEDRRAGLLAADQQQLVMGMRPEHLRLGNAEPVAGASFEAEVDVIEQMGSEMLLELTCQDNGLTVSRVDPTLAVAPGDSVTIEVDRNRLHFFHPETEDTLS